MLLVFVANASAETPNVLIISVDDMNCDSVGAYGILLKNITPRMDQLAAEGMRFEYAPVMVGNCYPGRNVMFSGRSSHSNLVEGFYPIKEPHYPHLADLMKEGSYFTGVLGKETRSTPYYPYPWDLEMGEGVKKDNHIKDAGSCYRMTAKGIAASKKADKSFCLLINLINDPEYRDEIAAHRSILGQFMEKTKDPVYAAF